MNTGKNVSSGKENTSSFWQLYPGPLLAATPEGKVIRANEAAMTFMGAWGWKEGRPLPREWKEPVQQVYASGLPYVEEFVLGQRTYLMHIRPALDAGEVWLFGQDITELKEAQVLFLQHTDLLQSVLSMAPVGIFSADAEGYLHFIQGKIFEELSFDILSFVGHSLYELVYNPDEVREAVQKALEGEVNRCVFEIVNSEDASFWVCWFSPQRDEEGRIVGVYGLLLDYTEDREQMEGIVRFNEKLRQKMFERTRQLLKANFTLQTSFRGSLKAMSKLGELYSPLLGGHERRVARLAIELGKILKLSQQQLIQLEVAALLHDVGKIRLSQDALVKTPKEMTSEQKAILLKHPVLGAEIVQAIPGMEEAARAIRHHHEHFDGTGFPDRLQGEEIPFLSRIIAVANAYDRHLYGGKLSRVSEVAAYARVREKADSHFDPVVVRALEKHIIGYVNEASWQKEQKVRIRVSHLKPGMVLAQDMFDHRMVLLLPMGTRLTREHIMRLKVLLRGGDIPKAVWIHSHSIKQLMQATERIL